MRSEATCQIIICKLVVSRLAPMFVVFHFLSDLLCWVMLMFSSHVAVFTGVKDCMTMVKLYAVFLWSRGIEEIALWLSRWSVPLNFPISLTGDKPIEGVSKSLAKLGS